MRTLPENVCAVIVEQCLDLWRLEILDVVVDWDPTSVGLYLTPVISTSMSPCKSTFSRARFIPRRTRCVPGHQAGRGKCGLICITCMLKLYQPTQLSFPYANRDEVLLPMWSASQKKMQKRTYEPNPDYTCERVLITMECRIR